MLMWAQKPPPRVLPHRAACLLVQSEVSLCSWMVVSRTLSLSHVSVKTKMQQSLNSHCLVHWSQMYSSLLSSEQMFESRMNGRAGRLGFALTIAQTPACLLCFCFLAHCFRWPVPRPPASGDDKDWRPGLCSNLRHLQQFLVNFFNASNLGVFCRW